MAVSLPINASLRLIMARRQKQKIEAPTGPQSSRPQSSRLQSSRLQYRYEHFAPENQISSIHAIADRLLSAYTVEGGNVHLAGCRMENRLFVRASAQHAGRSVSFFLNQQGEELDPTLAELLGVEHLQKLEHPPEENGDHWVEPLVQLARQRMIQQFDPKNPPETVDIVAIWCKHVEGRLRFTIDDESVDLPFSDWVRTLRPTPYHSPYSEVESFHLAATDDHRIVPAEAIEICEETGRHVLADELVTCAETGQRLVAELAETCPISGKPVRPEHMIVCEHCGQRVAPSTVDRGWCAACRTRHRVRKSDPRLARLKELNPELNLAPWRHWQLAETDHVLVITANRCFKQLLLVADVKTGKLLRRAKRFRPLGHWKVF